jgi:hypothetical protein
MKRTYGSSGVDAAVDLRSRCASTAGVGVINGDDTSFNTRHRDKTTQQVRMIKNK